MNKELFSAFSQIYTENQEKSPFEKFSVSYKGRSVGMEETLLAEKIVTKKKLKCLHLVSGKMA